VYGLRSATREVQAGWAALAGRTVAFTDERPGSHVDPSGLGGFYIDFSHKAIHARETGGGMPRDLFGDSIEWVIPVAQAALGFWELKLEGHDTDREFLRLTDWLVSHAAPAAAGVEWRVDVAVPKYKLGPGWPSAMGQGLAASALLRAHELTGRTEYLDTARDAFGPLTVPVARGGLQSEIDGELVLEEYPTAEPTAVLNGWIFSLLGIHELAMATGDEEVRRLVDRSASGVVALLPRFDVGWWSLYSLHPHGRPDLAKPFYQRLHAVLLRALHLVRPAAALDGYARRWEEQISALSLARVSVNKVGFRLYRTVTERGRANNPAELASGS